MNTTSHHKPVRWWPVVLIAVLAVAAIIYGRFIQSVSHQQGNIITLVTLVVSGLWLLVWLLFFSRLSWRTRWWALGLGAGCLGIGIGVFRIKGVSGDLMPIWEYRWTAPEAAGAEASAVTGRTSAEGNGALVSPGGDYPQFLGPHRNATLPEGLRLARDWVARPPTLLWRQPIGASWSGFAVVGNRAVTQEQHGEEERVVCYELSTGRILWTHADKARYASTIAGTGPRATPTIVSNRVLTTGATGILNCLELGTGRRLWTRQIITENHSRMGDWGVTGAPLVRGGQVIVNPGGAGRSLVAYRLADGELAWGGGDDEASNSAATTATFCGVEQILIFNQRAVFGHDAASGRVLWEFPWQRLHPKVSLPVSVSGDRVLISSGYGAGAALLQIARDTNGAFSATRVWKNTRLKAKFNNFVTRGDFIYGLDDGILACLEIATGEQKWKEGRYGHGQFILVRDVLLMTAENGEVVLIDPVPEGPRELTRFAAVKGKTWNPPALAGDLLLVRNDQEAACYRLPIEK